MVEKDQTQVIIETMMKLDSVFWSSGVPSKTTESLKALGFHVGPSWRDSACQSVFFGPDSFEIFKSGEKLSTLQNAGSQDGIVGLGFQSTDIRSDFRRLKDLKNSGFDEKPRGARDSQDGHPLWTGFTLPENLTLGLPAFVVMNSPDTFQKMSLQKLPVVHPNSCFGIESVQIVHAEPHRAANAFGLALDKKPVGLQWTDLVKSEGFRLQLGEYFLDMISPKPGLEEGVLMVTLKVVDLELAQKFAIAAGAKVQPCANRDGFILTSRDTGGPALRFIRSFWRAYLPPTSNNFPLGRRTDEFRPLGGANSTTLEKGFEDDWTY